MVKSADAFRTISEVADWLGVPAHVLRFWESKFTQIKPVKRAGGRRYYRPADMQLLGGIRKLLHDDGMTIKGVQKILREEGVRRIAVLSPPFEGDEDLYESGIALDVTPDDDGDRGTVLRFGRGADAAVAGAWDPEFDDTDEDEDEDEETVGGFDIGDDDVGPVLPPPAAPRPPFELAPDSVAAGATQGPDRSGSRDAAAGDSGPPALPLDAAGTGHGDVAPPTSRKMATAADEPSRPPAPLSPTWTPRDPLSASSAPESAAPAPGGNGRDRDPASGGDTPVTRSPGPEAQDAAQADPAAPAEPDPAAEPVAAPAAAPTAAMPDTPPDQAAVAPRITAVTLPDDPADTIAAPPGPLARLAALPRPLPRQTALALAALAERLQAVRPSRDMSSR